MLSVMLPYHRSPPTHTHTPVNIHTHIMGETCWRYFYFWSPLSPDGHPSRYLTAFKAWMKTMQTYSRPTESVVPQREDTGNTSTTTTGVGEIIRVCVCMGGVGGGGGDEWLLAPHWGVAVFGGSNKRLVLWSPSAFLWRQRNMMSTNQPFGCIPDCCRVQVEPGLDSVWVI